MADLARVRDDQGPCAHGARCAHAAEREGQAADALARAEAICAAQGLKLTPIRREVLQTLLATHRPLGAYDIAERMAEGGSGRRRLAPITVYRALDFLIESGLVHRLASRNAFIACPQASRRHDPVAFLICDACGGVDELHSKGLVGALRGLLDAQRFEPRSQMLEITGLCAHCQPLVSPLPARSAATPSPPNPTDLVSP